VSFALGAADLDEALWDLCALELRDKHRIDVAKASRAGGRLLAEVVKAKRTCVHRATRLFLPCCSRAHFSDCLAPRAG
jgi:molecular chaperone DnaK (HSP70)